VADLGRSHLRRRGGAEPGRKLCKLAYGIGRRVRSRGSRRSRHLSETAYDLVIVGGGINGCGIARDAAGRGLKVLLAERGDLASGTSSASTKLIHGGLRYLEHYEFRLVAEALAEREVLWAMAPHIIWPLRFVLPHHKALRPMWLVGLGLLLYDRLGGRRLLPASRRVAIDALCGPDVLQPEFQMGFEYADCWVEDSRLVVLNAVDAATRGAEIHVGTEVVAARRTPDGWSVDLMEVATGRTHTISARGLVNAAGPWVEDVLTRRLGRNTRSHMRLVKGSHIVVPRLYPGDRAFIFQQADRRIVFAIPYETDFTLIGTTDVDVTGDPSPPAASPAEIAYLCEAANSYFVKPITPADIVWTYAGIRPLYDDGDDAQSVTRDFVLELDKGADTGNAPLLSIFGGKITTYRRLAEEALERLSPWFPEATKPWTRGATLPGGDIPVEGFDGFVADLVAAWPHLPAPLLRRLARAYGTRTRDLLAGVVETSDLGLHFGAGLHAHEVEWLIHEEWARTADDVLWRRSKLGLRISPAQKDALARFISARLAEPAAPHRS
jgi:glycerol-3-phosphate dehydrogenase